MARICIPFIYFVLSLRHEEFACPNVYFEWQSAAAVAAAEWLVLMAEAIT